METDVAARRLERLKREAEVEMRRKMDDSKRIKPGEWWKVRRQDDGVTNRQDPASALCRCTFAGLSRPGTPHM